MSSQVCIKTHKSLQQLTTEIQKLLALPPFTENAFAGEPYCQFEMFGMLVLIHRADEEDRDPEVVDFPYSFELQFSFTDTLLDTDAMEYEIQPYYAQLLAFHLNVETAYYEKHKIGPHWQIRYRYCRKNEKWNGAILYGEEGWEPSVVLSDPTPWRTRHPAL